MTPSRHLILVAGAVFLLSIGLLRAYGAPGPATQSDPAQRTAIQAVAEQAPVVFTAKVEAVKTTSDDAAPTVIMDVTLSGPALLKGDRPENLTLPYRIQQGKGFTPQKGQDVLAAISHVLTGPIIGGPPTFPGQPRPIPGSEWRIVLLVPATAENVAAANAGIAQSPQGKLKAAVRGAELVFVATVDKAREIGHMQPTLLQVTMKDLTMLKGEKPAILDCPYPVPPAAPALFRPFGGETVLIAAHPAPAEAGPPPGESGAHSGPLPVLGGNGPPIFFMANATDENIALAKTALADPATKPAANAPGAGASK